MAKALRKAGVSWTVSARALIIRVPTPGSFAQDGTRPREGAQLAGEIPGVAVQPLQDCPHRVSRGGAPAGGEGLGPQRVTPNSETRPSGLLVETKRPHMTPGCLPPGGSAAQG